MNTFEVIQDTAAGEKGGNIVQSVQPSMAAFLLFWHELESFCSANQPHIHIGDRPRPHCNKGVHMHLDCGSHTEMFVLWWPKFNVSHVTYEFQFTQGS